MNLPNGVKQLTTVEEVRQAWGDLLTVQMGAEESDREILFVGDPRVAITAEAVYIQLRKPIRAGQDVELTDVLRIPEPTVATLRLADKYAGGMEKAICILTALCGIPNAEISNMPASDFALAGEVIGAFL